MGVNLSPSSLNFIYIFFSIFDLIQYTIAVERKNELIVYLYTKYNPGVVRIIKQAIEGVHGGRIPCGICGEAARNEKFHSIIGRNGIR